MQLGSLVIPTTLGGLDEILENFQIWDHGNLLPYDKPKPKNERIRLIISLNTIYNPEFETVVRSSFNKSNHIKLMFSGLEFLYCGLEGLEDSYITDKKGKIGPVGYKSGPNIQFFTTIKLVQAYGDYMFYMETDCYPLRRNWLGILEQRLKHMPDFWVMGSIYRGFGPLYYRYRRHLNGNAIYASGSQHYQDFLEKIVQPYLAKETMEKFPELAYDCVYEYIANDDLTPEAKDLIRLIVSKDHMFVSTTYICNYGGALEHRGTHGYKLHEIMEMHDDICVVHGRYLKTEVLKLKNQ